MFYAIDFGVSTFEQTTTIVGTLEWMAPEGNTNFNRIDFFYISTNFINCSGNKTLWKGG